MSPMSPGSRFRQIERLFAAACEHGGNASETGMKSCECVDYSGHYGSVNPR